MDSLVEQTKSFLTELAKTKRLYVDKDGEYLEVQSVRVYTRSRGARVLPEAFIFDLKD